MLKQFFEANDEMLDLYTNAITKAHGKNHPEVFDVRKVYETIQHKIRIIIWTYQMNFQN